MEDTVISKLIEATSQQPSSTSSAFEGAYGDPSFRPSPDTPQLTRDALLALGNYFTQGMKETIERPIDQARTGQYSTSAESLRETPYSPTAPLMAAIAAVGGGWPGRGKGPNSLGQISSWESAAPRSLTEKFVQQIESTLDKSRNLDNVKNILSTVEEHYPNALPQVKSLTYSALKGEHGESLASNIRLSNLDDWTLAHEIGEVLIQKKQPGLGRGAIRNDPSLEKLADGIAYLITEKAGIKGPKRPDLSYLEKAQSMLTGTVKQAPSAPRGQGLHVRQGGQ